MSHTPFPHISEFNSLFSFFCIVQRLERRQACDDLRAAEAEVCVFFVCEFLFPEFSPIFHIPFFPYIRFYLGGGFFFSLAHPISPICHTPFFPYIYPFLF